MPDNFKLAKFPTSTQQLSRDNYKNYFMMPLNTSVVSGVALSKIDGKTKILMMLLITKWLMNLLKKKRQYKRSLNLNFLMQKWLHHRKYFPRQ